MKIKSLLPLAFIATLLLANCSKNDPEPAVEEEEETVEASSSAVSVFHKTDTYYQMYVYRYDSTSQAWTSRIASHFSTVPEDDATYIGFTNPYVVNSGVNLFGMVTLYQGTIGTNNIKEAKINAEKVLQFFPESEGATKGTVKVKEQDIVITKKDSVGTFTIGIGGEGTYDEETKVIDLVVKFNETNIGGSAAVYRKYKLSVDALSLQ
ncbi:MAG: hypothetical protein QM669_02440 [Siphonobacter sp.]